MEVPSFVKRSNIAPKIVIPNPNNKEGRERVYISRKFTNGWKDQPFTSKDCPDCFSGVYVHEDEDPGNQTIHPSYLTVVTRKKWVPYGLKGWKNASKELCFIAKKLMSPNEGVANIREVYNSDIIAKRMPNGKFWLADSLVRTDEEGTHFFMMYVDNGKIKTSELCLIDSSGVHDKAGDVEASILAVVTLDTIINDSKTDRVRGLWDYY